jgi:hypothetical protein
VNTYLARTGGAQVAINKIDLDGKGTLLLALPGEDHAREIGAASGSNVLFSDCNKNTFLRLVRSEPHRGPPHVLLLCV